MNSYLNKHAFTEPIIQSEPSQNLGIFVVVPVYKENDIKSVFSSLINQALPICDVEILFVFNASENDSAENKALNKLTKESLDKLLITPYRQFEKLGKPNESIQDFTRIKAYTCAFNDLPKKVAGVGLARKIGMDEAVRRFVSLGKQGIIINTDADCLIGENYFVEIYKHFKNNQKTSASSIYFEHPLNKDSQEFNAIVQYELYLRYYINMQRLIGFPWAFQTIGSAMAVRSNAYQQQGGMNKRKAGEDFYFLQKHIELGNFTEINTTTVYASARQSDRVPFGTGKAIADLLATNQEYGFYNPNSFEQLDLFFSQTDKLYKSKKETIESVFKVLPNEIATYLNHNNWTEKIIQINRFTSDLPSFKKRFFREFNAFQLMKCLHWLRDEHFKNVSPKKGIDCLFKKLKLEIGANLSGDLKKLREYDKNNSFYDRKTFSAHF